MNDIKPRIVDGEPLCLTGACPICEECPYARTQAGIMAAYKLCAPGLRRQRDDARAEVERLREVLLKIASEKRDFGGSGEACFILDRVLYNARAALTSTVPR